MQPPFDRTAGLMGLQQASARRMTTKELFPTPQWLPQRMDSTRKWVRLVRFDEQDYRAAPFLDERGFSATAEVTVVSWDEVASAIPATARRDAHFLFHMGRVGSTLLSRLLAECGPVLPLREPPMLASPLLPKATQRGPSVDQLRALFARTFDPRQRAMIKATSVVSEIATELCGPSECGSRAAMIGVSASSFIAARLADNGGEMERRAAERLSRLGRRIPTLNANEALSTRARLAAATWATEATALDLAARALGERAFVVDFDRFLERPLPSMLNLSRHFGLAPDEGDVERLLGGPIMQRYSKREDRAFSPADRQQRLAASADRHDDEIADAVGWLTGVANGSPAISSALERFGT